MKPGDPVRVIAPYCAFRSRIGTIERAHERIPGHWWVQIPGHPLMTFGGRELAPRSCVVLQTEGLCIKCGKPAAERHAAVDETKFSRLYCEACCPECSQVATIQRSKT